MESALEQIVESPEVGKLEVKEAPAPAPETDVVADPVLEPEAKKREDDFKSLREHKKNLERDNAAIRKEAEELRRERDYQRGRLEALEQVSPKAQPPKWEDFQGDVEAYADAKNAYRELQKHQEADKARTANTAKQSESDARKQSIDEVWAEQISIASAVDAELTSAVDRISKGYAEGIHPDVADAIKESPVGLEILKHIGIHPTFASELAKLDRDGQARRLLALENMARSRGGSLSHLRVASSQPLAVVPPKISGQSASARGTQSLDSAGDINEWRAKFRNTK